MSKIGKKLIKGVKEAIKDTKEKKLPGRLVCDGKNWIAEDGTKFKTFDEMLDHDHKLAQAKFRKLPAEKRKAIKEKEKKQRLKWKEQDRKNEIKWAKQRAKRGYADCDLWNMDLWLLEIMPKMIDELARVKHGWNDNFGYIVKNNKLVKTKEKITAKQETEVLKYLSNGLKKLHAYANLDDLDPDKRYSEKYYIERQKKSEELHKEIFECLTSYKVFHSLWD